MRNVIRGIALSSALLASALTIVSAQEQTMGEETMIAPSEQISAPGVIAPSMAATTIQTPNYPASAKTAAGTAGTAAAKINSASTATSQTFQGPVVTIYEFSAPWCPSCHKLEPIVKKIAQKHKSFLELIKINTDKNPQMSRQMNITAIPQLIILDKRGRMLNRLIGYDQGIELDAIITNYEQQTANQTLTQQVPAQ